MTVLNRFHEIHVVSAGPPMGEPYCFWKQSANRTKDMAENVPQNVFFGFHSTGYGFFWGKKKKKNQSSIRYPIFHRKGYLHFCRPTPHFSKVVMLPKNYFSQLFQKILGFFFEKIVEWKIFKISFPYVKGYIYFCRHISTSTKNGHVLPQMVFRSFFRKCCFFFEKLM